MNIIKTLTVQGVTYALEPRASLHYGTLADALADWNAGTQTRCLFDTDQAAVHLDWDRGSITLLADRTEEAAIPVTRPVTLVLAGHALTFSDPAHSLVSTTTLCLDGTAPGSALSRLESTGQLQLTGGTVTSLHCTQGIACLNSAALDQLILGDPTCTGPGSQTCMDGCQVTSITVHPAAAGAVNHLFMSRSQTDAPVTLNMLGGAPAGTCRAALQVGLGCTLTAQDTTDPTCVTVTGQPYRRVLGPVTAADYNALADLTVLPPVTAADGGKFLRVSGDTWAAVTVPSAEEVAF